MWTLEEFIFDDFDAFSDSQRVAYVHLLGGPFNNEFTPMTV